jgi:2-dehydropantoate 2-reductase
VSILIVGAGAAGGYIGAQLAAADRDVTFLVHPRALDRLTADGLRIRLGADVVTTSVRAATRLFASMSPDGTINVVTPGIDVQIGAMWSRPCGRNSHSSRRRPS